MAQYSNVNMQQMQMQQMTPSQMQMSYPQQQQPIYYAPPKVEGEEESSFSNCILCLASCCSIFFIILTFPVSIWMVFQTVREYERAVIYRMGRVRSGGARGPGTFFVVPCIDDYRQVDLRTVSFDVPPQEILTKDSVTIQVDAVVFYKVQDPMTAINNVVDFSFSTRMLAQTQLRNVLGTKNLSEILSGRDEIANQMQLSLDMATDPWGVKVERVEIKDARLPPAFQGAMAAEAAATREVKAKIISAQGECDAAKSLNKAAELMASSPATMQLRYLQTLSQIGARNKTYIFPVPVDMLKSFSH